ncbi:hypothetical protein PPACK8108_LOCUS18605 [Phakopsora pachyrhizi]|uniref:Uncharacterized protein n=1 Tax=Phakopsora pachyrhizi TaxID=170000 RepID=A0AAV0BF53_PHAPC|nr:hypothetical protein PPACK8108_LOCUS18605 [Phakopsora pachyrhizi]
MKTIDQNCVAKALSYKVELKKEMKVDQHAKTKKTTYCNLKPFKPFHGNNRATFYTDYHKQSKPQPRSSSGCKMCNLIYWLPKGRHVVTVTLGLMSKFDLELWDTDLNESEKELGSGIQLIRSVEHYGVTKLEWDPSVRYIASIG